MPRPSVLAGLFATLLVACLLPGVSAQGDGPYAVVLREVPADGVTYDGNLHRFGWALLTADGVPTFHRDAVFEVRFGNVTLFRTERSSGHDYDAQSRFLVNFPGAGPYEVRTAVPVGSAWAQDTFTGVVEPRALAEASLRVEAPATATVGQAVTFTYTVADAEGEPVPHAHVLFEVWHTAEDRRVFAVDTHQHAEAQSLTYAFQQSGRHEVRLTAFHAFPDARVLPFAAFSATHDVEVAAGLPVTVPSATTNPPAQNRADAGQAEAPYTLHALYDPYTSVGPNAKIRVSALVFDPAAQRPAEHIDFSATLTGPGGDILFRSDRLHAYDGILEVVTAHPRPGDYTLRFEAQSTRHAWQGSVEAVYSVQPAPAPLTVRPYLVTVDGLDALKAGVPGPVVLHIRDPAGGPLAHSEIDFRITEASTGQVWVAGKLHTHSNASFPFVVALPAAGDWVLHADPFDLNPTPNPTFHGPSLGASRAFAFTVDDGPGFPVLAPEGPPEAPEDAAQTIPGLGVAAVLVLLAVAARRMGRRGP